MSEGHVPAAGQPHFDGEVPHEGTISGALDLIDGIVEGFDESSREFLLSTGSMTQLVPLVAICAGNQDVHIRSSSFALLGDLSSVVAHELVSSPAYPTMLANVSSAIAAPTS